MKILIKFFVLLTFFAGIFCFGLFLKMDTLESDIYSGVIVAIISAILSGYWLKIQQPRFVISRRIGKVTRNFNGQSKEYYIIKILNLGMQHLRQIEIRLFFFVRKNFVIW